jgi:glycerate dehydrogenase
MRIVVLDAHTADHGALGWDALGAHGDLAVYPRTRPDELLERAQDAEALLTNKVILDAAILAQLPRLRYIGILATGTNAVDLVACRQRGVAVTNVPGYSTHSVAQLVFALLLHLTHDVAAHSASVKSGAWAAGPDFSYALGPLVELANKTLTVLGHGAIGRTVADVARALGMRVLAAQVPGSVTAGRAPLAEALPESDVVTLHCPLTEATQGLVNDDFLRRLKPGAILVNTGRGALIDEAALLRALDAGTLGGVALDVLASEPPPPGHRLLDPEEPWARRVVVTPHIGWATVEARERLIAQAAANLGAFLRGEALHRVEGS